MGSPTPGHLTIARRASVLYGHPAIQMPDTLAPFPASWSPGTEVLPATLPGVRGSVWPGGIWLLWVCDVRTSVPGWLGVGVAPSVQASHRSLLSSSIGQAHCWHWRGAIVLAAARFQVGALKRDRWPLAWRVDWFVEVPPTTSPSSRLWREELKSQ